MKYSKIHNSAKTITNRLVVSEMPHAHPKISNYTNVLLKLGSACNKILISHKEREKVAAKRDNALRK